ncbi:MAG: polysaccharide deacetylase family protein [Actinobacteria bacterium]|nr:polysaccharide deacetylase family protein [Actinomycetota bacterium]
MRSTARKQRLKNGIYRAVGEVAGLGRREASEPLLRVLMYHKVDGREGNTIAVPPALFAEQMRLVADRYRAVSIDDVVAHLDGGRRLPPRAVLITFDDGYRDNLEEAAPVLERLGLPAIVFVPADFVGASRPLPHDERLVEAGLENPALDWDGLAELVRCGIAIGSHGLSHRVLSTLPPDEAMHEIVESRRILQERLGRPVEAFAYVKGGAAHFGAAHAAMVAEAGYRVAFSTFTGANREGADRFRLRRYNVEPYPMRTFELVLEGRCDALGVKDTVVGTHARRVFNEVLGTSTA